MFNPRQHDQGIFVRIPLPVPGHFYVSPMPYGPYDPFNRLMKLYRRHHVRNAIVLVTDEELKKKAKRDLLSRYGMVGIRVIRYPLPDLTSPRETSFFSLLDTIEHCLERENVAVHCNAGVGRTGVVAASMVRHLTGCTGEEAVGIIARSMHVNMTDEQIRFMARDRDAL